MSAAMGAPGFYGKLPSVGDFVTRRLPRHFVQPWDTWIQTAMHASQERLGSQWLDIYRTSPIWRFALSRGCCGDSAWAGVLMPSVDRVGRCFPLTLAVEIGRLSPAAIFMTGGPWFERMETVALAALEPETALDAFDQMTREEPLEPPGAEACGIRKLSAAQRPARVRVQMDAVESAPGALVELVGSLVGGPAGSHSIWSTSGSERVDPSLLVYEGLPGVGEFAGLLAGAYPPRDETTRDYAVVPPPLDPAIQGAGPDSWREAAPNADAGPIQWRSSGATSAGKVRDHNEDAWLARVDAGIWAVADGMGGHKSGAMASQAIVEGLGGVVAGGGLDELTGGVIASLRKVNAELLAAAEVTAPGEIIGSTVVVMIARGHRCADIWSGDSRLYRYRGGSLSQLTRDHSLAQEVPALRETAENGRDRGVAGNVLTKAVGVKPELPLETITFEGRGGDMYLLCSDGLIKELEHEEIAELLKGADCEDSARRLIDLALDRGARDNVTVVVIKAGRG